MPLYVYECDACGHRIEELQKLGEEPPKSCEDCPSKDKQCQFVKQMTTAGFDFRASEGVGGWEASMTDKQGTRNGDVLVRKKRGKLGPPRIFDGGAKKARKRTG